MNNKLYKIISRVSKYTLGIYLIHPFILMVFNKLSFHSLLYNIPLIMIPLISIDTFISSLFIIFIISKIKFINKIVGFFKNKLYYKVALL